MVTPAELQAAWDARQGRTRLEELLDRLEREACARWTPRTRALYLPLGGMCSKEEVAAQLLACRGAGWEANLQNTGHGVTLVLRPAGTGEAASSDDGEGEL